MTFNKATSSISHQREQLQLLFDNCFSTGNKENLRKQYKTLRQLELSNSFDYANEIIDISSLTQSISMACDILIAETGTSIIYCGNKTSHALCNQRFFTKALLNLISNAYLYGYDKLITIKTVEISDFIQVEVQSSGIFINNNTGKGLNFVHNVCKNANGRFFIEQSHTQTRAIMIFEKAQCHKELVTHDFYALINDRLSPVYVELFGMEYH